MHAGHIAVGWLVVEDLFTVILLVVLPVLVGVGTAPTQLWTALALTGAKVAGLIAVTVLAGQRAIPWLLAKISRTESRELFTLTVLVIALSLADAWRARLLAPSVDAPGAAARRTRSRNHLITERARPARESVYNDRLSRTP